jgi:uncharacterized protein YukE
LLGQDDDPVPGDSEAVRRLGAGYAATAQEVETLAGRLRRLSGLSEWNGEAAEKFAASAEDTAHELAKAQQRYRKVATATTAWAVPLEEARRQSAGALDDAELADQALRRTAASGPGPGPDATPDQVQAEQDRQQAHDSAQDALDSARRRLDSALAALDDAAEAAAHEIRGAAESFSDSVWDNVKGAMRSVANALHLKTVVDVLGWVALALAIVAVVAALVLTSPAWLPALLVAGAVVGVSMLAIHAVLLASDSGDATWADIALDIVGIIPVTAGARIAGRLGRALPTARTAMADAAEAAARTAAAAAESAKPALQAARNAGHIADASNPLRRWADRFVQASGQAVEDAGKASRVPIEDVPDVAPALINRLKSLNEDLARNAEELARLGRLPQAAAAADELSEAARDLARLQGLNAAALAAQLADAVNQVADAAGVEAAQWKQQLVDLRRTTAWRLTLPG